MTRIASYGEALVDMIPCTRGSQEQAMRYEACLGGSIFNFSIAISLQGVACTYINPLSTDAFGQQFAKKLSACGGHLGSTPVPAATALAVVTIGATGNSYQFYRDGVAYRAIRMPQALAAIPASAQLLHTGCLTLLPSDWPETQELLDAAKAKGLLISVDANLRPVACDDASAYSQCVWEAIAKADIVKCSDEDLAVLGMGGLEATLAALQIFAKSQARLLAITCGAQGAYLFTRTAHSYSAVPAGMQVHDTVGAGDCFCAAMLAWLARQSDLSRAYLDGLSVTQLQRCVLHAVHAAGISVTRAGCAPATWEETCAAAGQLSI
jgi:fructokinase